MLGTWVLSDLGQEMAGLGVMGTGETMEITELLKFVLRV